MEKLVQELDASNPGTRLSSMEGMAENAYFQACIKENLRYTPVFVMPLPRRVPDGGREIAGEMIPAGVIPQLGRSDLRCRLRYRLSITHYIETKKSMDQMQINISLNGGWILREQPNWTDI
jgi:hypothetical protein